MNTLGAAGPVIPPMPEVLRAAAWPKFLKGFLKANPFCLGCGRKAQTGHHLIPVAVDPGRELDAANVVPVCVPCHFVICHGGDWRTYSPTARSALATHRRRKFIKPT